MLKGRHPDQAQINLLALKHLGDPARSGAPEVQAALRQALASVEGTQDFIDLVERFGVRGQQDALRRMAFEMPDSSFGVDALRLLLATEEEAVRQALDQGDAGAVLAQLGYVDTDAARTLIEAVILDPERALEVRRQAVGAMARTWGGEERLLALARAGRVPDALKPAAASILLNVWRAEVREEAAQYLDQPADASAEPLPPIRSLAAAVGNPVENSHAETVCTLSAFSVAFFVIGTFCLVVFSIINFPNA